MEEKLKKAGISYIWLGKELGGYRKGGYEEYTKTLEFKEGLNKLIRFAMGRRSAIMCAELLWFRCHRRFISRALHEFGFDVIHIIDERRIYREKEDR